MNQLSSNPNRSARSQQALAAAPLLFWPGFLLLTILEEKAGVSWLQTENAALWHPTAVAALVVAGIAPLFIRGNARRKMVAAIGSLIAFAVAYGLVILIGASFLNWGD